MALPHFRVLLRALRKARREDARLQQLEPRTTVHLALVVIASSTAQNLSGRVPTRSHVQSKDGTSIAYWQSGRGSALVLVHGTTADHQRWAPILPALEKRFTVYVVDGRGRGGSGDAPNYALERESEDIAAVVDAIGEAVFLLGHSHGAICSLEATLRTSNVSKLILYEPSRMGRFIRQGS
ncbi:MAG TPA: alpha/beta fold hydrolase [Vicinamibacteria bacterium]|nr:alpha/beta fold hydrolase [Vicinamibacteria bacterium]